MRELFFGQIAVILWFVASALFVFCASYIWIIVAQVGGLRGTCLAIVFTCCAIITSGFGLLLSGQGLISHAVLGAAISAMWPPIVICALMLTDLYAADRNSHRSFTARSYAWYKRITQSPREDADPHHPIELQHGPARQ